MVGEQLQGNGEHDGREQGVGLRHFHHGHAVGIDDAGVRIREDVEPAAAGAHFFEVGSHFPHQLAARRNRHHGHVLIHQRQRAVLQFARRIAFGVDVGNLLEFERPFQSDRIVCATTEKQRVVAMHELHRQTANAAVQGQRFLHNVRQFAQGIDEFALLFRWQPLTPCEQDGEHHQHRELRGERLGGGNADFRAGFRWKGDVRFAHLGAGGDVADGERVREASGFGDVVGGQRVRGFAGLGNGHEQAAGGRDELAVAELRCDLHVAGQAGEFLDPIAGDCASVVGGAAGCDGDGAGVVQHLLGIDAEGGFQDAALA